MNKSLKNPKNGEKMQNDMLWNDGETNRQDTSVKGVRGTGTSSEYTSTCSKKPKI